MIKFVWLLILAAIAVRLLIGKWPWQLFSAHTGRRDALVKARKLLNVGADATRQEITDAHRRVLAVVHPDRGGSNASVHEANDARDLLLNNLPTESRDS